MVMHSSIRTQKCVSLLCAEAEYNSLASGACDAVLIRSCVRFVSPVPVAETVALVDNSAANYTHLPLWRRTLEVCVREASVASRPGQTA